MERKIAEYMLVEARFHSLQPHPRVGLEYQVREAMRQGWEPLGGVAAFGFSVEGSGDTVYVQAMVKYQ